jgi:hypothetical protein
MPVRNLLTLLALLATLALIVACGPAAPASPAPAATPVATPVSADTPEPIGTPEPIVTPEPVDTPAPVDTPDANGTPDPAATPVAGTLEQMLPTTIGGQTMQYMSMHPGMLGPDMGFGDDEFSQQLQDMGVSSDDIEVAVGAGEVGVVTAIRIRGLTADQLQQLFMAQHGQLTQTTLGGRTAWQTPTQPGTPPAWLLVAGDVMLSMVLSEEHATEVVQQLP